MRPRLSIDPALGANAGIQGEAGPFRTAVSYRHRYRCWVCKWEGVLEFEPHPLEPGWTECHHCGIDNEIPAGLYDRPTIIPGHVPSRIF